MVRKETEEIILWTDGSAMPNPGPGGFAVIREYAGERPKVVVMGHESKSSNIRMEGAALIAAIKYAGKTKCEIHTDSQFWINVLTKWAPGWAANDWHKNDEAVRDKDGKIVDWKETKIKNLDIVKKLYEIYREANVKLVWEKGHAGTELNEMADEWAKKAREMGKAE